MVATSVTVLNVFQVSNEYIARDQTNADGCSIRVKMKAAQIFTAEMKMIVFARNFHKKMDISLKLV